MNNVMDSRFHLLGLPEVSRAPVARPTLTLCAVNPGNAEGAAEAYFKVVHDPLWRRIGMHHDMHMV